MPGLRINIFMLIFFSLFTALLHASNEPKQIGKAVLITGASSGFGRQATEQLAAAGYFVYAGARKDADIEALNAIQNVQAVRLDVTRPEQIAAAVETVRAGELGLWGLVNNAGVNVIDPLIIESKGRIVNISSIGGILSGGPMIGYGPYTMSKHAIEAFSDQLESEVTPLGVKVIAIEPGSFSTKIGESRCKRMLAQISDREYRYYAETMKNYSEGCQKRLEEDLEVGADPKPVSDAIEQALFAENPKSHYLVTSNEFEARITIGKLFEELLSLNYQQEYSFSREQLIEMMDEVDAVVKREKELTFD